jgi:hypothetical protein
MTVISSARASGPLASVRSPQSARSSLSHSTLDVARDYAVPDVLVIQEPWTNTAASQTQRNALIVVQNRDSHVVSSRF